MRKLWLLLFLAPLINACNSGLESVQGVTVNAAPIAAAKNVVPISVGCGYTNEPCITVTVCNPTTKACATINNVLIDTGSYGLRVFKGTVQSLGLQPVAVTVTENNSQQQVTVTPGGQPVGECQTYLDNLSDWGPIAMANVRIGGETTAQPIPIQIIDASFPDGSGGAGATNAGCDNPDTGSSGNFNGILGVGLQVADCGDGCTGSGNDTYFACESNGNCTNIGVPTGGPGQNLPLFQVSNPIPFFPDNNNGLIVDLPALSSAGAAGVNGYVIFGIGTSTNNQPPPSVVALPTDAVGDLLTKFEGHNYISFLDTGSNGLYFPEAGSGLSTDSAGFYDPTNLVSFTAVQSASGGSKSQTVPFSILGATEAFSAGSPNVAFNDIGAPIGSSFDWGLPFFFGRFVYVGIEGSSSSLGAGPVVAY